MKQEFQTPPFVCTYMKELLNDLLSGHDNIILEPTPGVKNLVNHALVDNDKVKQFFAPEDYFTVNNYYLRGTKFDGIIANPPFSDKSCILDNAPDHWKELKGMQVGYKFLEEFMVLSDVIIILMPMWTITDSDVRMRKIREFGLMSVTLLPRKTFNYARVQTAVLQLKKGYAGPTIFHTHLI